MIRYVALGNLGVTLVDSLDEVNSVYKKSVICFVFSGLELFFYSFTYVDHKPLLAKGFRPSPFPINP